MRFFGRNKKKEDPQGENNEENDSDKDEAEESEADSEADSEAEKDEEAEKSETDEEGDDVSSIEEEPIKEEKIAKKSQKHVTIKSTEDLRSNSEDAKSPENRGRKKSRACTIL